LKAGCKQKKLRLLARNGKACRDWVYVYKNWSDADWECVIWSDKTIIEHFGSHGWKWVWSNVISETKGLIIIYILYIIQVGAKSDYSGEAICLETSIIGESDGGLERWKVFCIQSRRLTCLYSL